MSMSDCTSATQTSRELSEKLLKEYIDLVNSKPSMAILINNYLENGKIAKMDNSKGSALFSLLEEKRNIDGIDYDILLFMSENTYEKIKLIFENIPVFKGIKDGKLIKW